MWAALSAGSVPDSPQVYLALRALSGCLVFLPNDFPGFSASSPGPNLHISKSLDKGTTEGSHTMCLNILKVINQANTLLDETCSFPHFDRYFSVIIKQKNKLKSIVFVCLKVGKTPKMTQFNYYCSFGIFCGWASSVWMSHKIKIYTNHDLWHSHSKIYFFNPELSVNTNYVAINIPLVNFILLTVMVSITDWEMFSEKIPTVNSLDLHAIWLLSFPLCTYISKAG